MPNSMTAFARAAVERPWGSMTWELRSVNHRYLECGFRLPDSLKSQEMNFRDLARSCLQRGKVDCTLQLVLSQEQAGISVNRAKAGQYVLAAAEIADMIDQPAHVSPLAILSLPGVIEEQEIDNEILQTESLDLFRQALTELQQGRRREGDKLSLFIGQRLDGINQETTGIRQMLPQILAGQEQRLRDRLDELAVTTEPDRIEQELVLMLQKADVAEELDRLQAHVEEIRRVLGSSGPMGRRLDFLMQELNREANTLSSKSLATASTRAAVELKVLIEQMREQIQNIE